MGNKYQQFDIGESLTYPMMCFKFLSEPIFSRVESTTGQDLDISDWHY